MNGAYTAYVGSYAEDTDGLHRLHVEPETGAMERVNSVDAGPNPSFLAIHPSEEYLYVVNEGDPGTVTAFEIADDGSLPRLNRVKSGGAGPCHLSVEATGAYVLVADYADGAVSMLPIAEDGSVEEPSHVVDHEGSSVNPERQDQPHVHSVTPGPDNEVAYVADLGTDELVVYDMDLAEGRLARFQTVTVHEGAGPRHVAIHPDGSMLYLLDELDGTVVVYQRTDRGELTEVTTVSTLPGGFEGENLTAEVLVHPTGEFLYASNRGHDSITVFELDDSGRPHSKVLVASGGEWPRNFALAPDGELLFAENQHTGDVRAFGIDRETGDIDPTGETIELSQPSCMRFFDS
ncbi:MAG: lactonase family protein [Halobacteriales archaeon]